LISDDAEAGEFSRDSQPQTLSELESSLAESGFSSTRIGKIDDDDVVVQWENTAFPHSDQKAINTTLKLTQKIPRNLAGTPILQNSHSSQNCALQ